MSNSGEHIIFVGGAPRSGTTLIQRILNAHSDIYGGPELDKIRNIVDLRNLFHFSIDNGMNTPFFTKESVDQKFANFISSLFDDVLEQKKKKYISEKTPNNILCFDTLLALFPKAKFIFIYRDPRAIVASMKEVKRKAKEKNQKIPHFTLSAKKSVHFINRFWQKGFEAYELNKERVFLMQYERLVSEPEAILKELCIYLNVVFEENLLAPNEENFDRWTSKDTIWYDNKKMNRNIDVSDKDKWKSTLTPYEILTVNQSIYKHQIIQNTYNLDDKSTFFVEFRYKINQFLEQLASSLLKGIIKIIRKTPVLKTLFGKVLSYAK